MVPRPSGPGIVLAPHPDDAVLSAWSVLAGPDDVLVVNVCSGVPPAGHVGRFDPLLGVTDSAALAAQRIEEDADALAIAGRERVNLDVLDDQYRSEPLTMAEARRAIEPALGDSAWLCAPAGIGVHPDHVAVRDAALALATERALAITLYADVPYATWAGWPHWVTGGAPRPYLVPEVRWHRDLAGSPIPIDALQPHPIALAPGDQARKRRALECYRSQFATLDGGPIGRITNPEVLGFELHWSIRPT